MTNQILAVGVLAGIIIGIVFALPIDDVESAIPPTPAWVNIASNDTDASTNPAWANATSYSDDLWIITDGSIKVEIIQYDQDPE